MHISGVMRPVMNRTIALRGPKFYRDGEDRAKVLFVNHIDSSTREGPREAMETDAVGHPDAWQRFVAEEAGIEPQTPLRPLVSFVDPPEGLPKRQKGPHEQKRDEAHERGEVG